MAELFSIFGRLKNNVTCFFYKKDFHKQHQAEIYSEIITVSGIKRSQNKKYSKYKNCWIKSITAAKFSHWWKAVYTPPLSKDTPPVPPPPPPPLPCLKTLPLSTPTPTPPPIFTRKSWSPFYDFWKIWTPL